MSAGAGSPGAEDAHYRAAGVDYDSLDAGKRLAMTKALSTSSLLSARGGRALDDSRGEPAFVFELGGRAFAFVVEGLGTKSLIARHVLEAQGLDRFADVAYDTVAAILNDLCCVGALPLVVNAYFATGASDWYLRQERTASLLEGWRSACADAGCTWGGGESPTLPGMLAERDIELAGAAVGVVPDGHEPILGERLRGGDEIVLVASSGLHANGASLARRVAGELADGYATPLPGGGESFGEALLAPSRMYAPLLAAALDARVPLTYASHVTGHGLRKLMRPARELRYRIERLPPVPAVLSFLAEQAGMDPHAAYATFNMGAGYALYCAAGAGEQLVALAAQLGLDALVAGHVEDGPREVVLEPLGIRYTSEQLALAPEPNP
ncbi:MAG TPA: AIR synthase-related protein [Solirubrobacteraceae bacterium]|nr:AIR synthase-related protein [Solirubrobacteraceae bacterium]